MPKKVILIAKLPSEDIDSDGIGYYSSFFVKNCKEIDFTVLCQKTNNDYETQDKKEYPNKKIIRCFHVNSFFSVFSIIKNLFKLRRQKIKNVHLQYEFFSYNSPIQGALFVFIQSLAMWILGFNRIITLHQIPDKSDIEERLNNKGLKSWFFFTAIKVYFWIIFLLYNKIVVHEGIFKERLVKKYNLKPDKIVIINHISYSYEKRENNKKLFPDDFEKYKNRLLFFGYLSWYKGLDNLIQDFLALPKEVQKDTFLTIVGGEHPKQKDDKDYQNWLLDLKNKTKEFKNIMWFGFAKDEDLQKIFTSHTALMLPYQNLFSSSGPFAWGLSYNLPPLVSGKMSYLKELGFISYEPRQLDKALKTFNSKKDHYLDLTKKIQKERGIEKIEKEMIGLYI